MCGIFGSNNIETFRELCERNTERGNFVRSVTRLFPEGLASKQLTTTTYDTDFETPIAGHPFCVYYLGHVQSPTSKIREFNEATSHPFTLNNQHLAHNGVLENDRALINEMGLEGCSDVDSSVILPLINKVGLKNSLEMLEGIFSCWYYNEKTGCLCIFRSGSTLHYDSGNFTSTATPGYQFIPEGSILEYNFTSNKFNAVDSFKLNAIPFFL